MNNPDWKINFNNELRRAETARSDGNEGMARVCARRAAGIILGEYYTRLGIPFHTSSAHERLKFLMHSTDISDNVKVIVDHFLIHVQADHQLPVDADLVEEVRWLEKKLLNNSEQIMTEKYHLIENLIDLIGEVPTESILSRTIFNGNQEKVILFGFASGQELSEHTASMPATIHILQGEVNISLEADIIKGNTGTWIHMPANMPHSIYAKTPTVIMLTLIKSGS